MALVLKNWKCYILFLGLHTLKRLVQSGSFDYIIGLGRDIKKCETAFKEVDELLETSTNVEFVECDLTKMHCVKEFASSVLSRMQKIDLLINVAGIMDAPHSVSNFFQSFINLIFSSRKRALK